MRWRERISRQSATRALDFIRRTLWRDGRLLATYKDGSAHLNAYLDDYVFLADAVLELQQTRFRARRAAVRARAARCGAGALQRCGRRRLLLHLRRSRGADASVEVVCRRCDAFGQRHRAPTCCSGWDTCSATRAISRPPRGRLRAAWAVLERYPQSHTSMLTMLEEYLHPPESDHPARQTRAHRYVATRAGQAVCAATDDIWPFPPMRPTFLRPLPISLPATPPSRICVREVPARRRSKISASWSGSCGADQRAHEVRNVAPAPVRCRGDTEE